MQISQISMICKTMTDPDHVLTTLDQVSIEESRPFLDLTVAGALWDEWDFSRAFRGDSTKSDLPTPLVAKILTINKCVAPCSHYEIDEQGLKYVSALDKVQIAGIGAIDWDSLTGVSWDNFKEHLHAWDCYDESLYFKDLGIYEGYRDAHVRAVYSICVLAYFLNKDLAGRRKKLMALTTSTPKTSMNLSKTAIWSP